MNDVTCEECKYWEKISNTGSGQCHRFPPTIPNLGTDQFGRLDDYFPMVSRRSWCGEWTYNQKKTVDKEGSIV